ncbi:MULTISPECIES: GntR family transcriptional regulator [unclassified Beijerinckia]|uniref:GntR family transcriptional regulator n=1 Tax=unclassified Beijerinckia TaxID=2638183 RepID=UPI0008980F5F|nr:MULTISPECIES: GntR family transcriptional regulator [unclassified Beijerinckia]MDH7795065.1 DNA-binding GntR family transcriptional regulator [Beijerinckia sp. GAS462]SEB86138.1 transcriptional regulator, GntR family [Beijerinckia sp. 28-YEA-48]
MSGTSSSTNSLRVYQELAQQILSGVLTPGHKLEEKVLAEQFGVSRTPVREALRELGARGLVDFTPRRGGVVAEISISQLADMLEAECEIEGLCAKLATQRMTALDKGNLLEIHRLAMQLGGTRSEATYRRLNNEFHDLICAGARNKTIATSARELRERLAAFRQTQSSSLKERMERSNEDHEAIVRAILAGQPEAAYEAMRKHNARLSSDVLRQLSRNAAPTSTK